MFNLFISLYPEQDALRRAELLECLDKNRQSSLIKRIYILNEGLLGLPSTKGYYERLIAHRTTYNDLFKFINEHTHRNEINIIANSDIYFDDTLVNSVMIKEMQCFAIARVGIPENYLAGSQDVWIFKGRIINIKADFPIGVPGCDNRLAHEIFKAGYDIINPCLTIKCHHLHKGKSWYKTRKYEPIPKPHRLIVPCEL